MTVPVGPDGRDVPHNDRCASCRGDCTKMQATETYGLPPKPIYTCVDRQLCKTIMMMEHSIANIRSA
jgi:hypothetical protein